MAVVAGDVALVTLKGTLASQTILNTFHYGMSIVVGAPTQNAVGIEITTLLQSAGNLVDKFLLCCPLNYTLDEMWVQFILDTRFAKQTFAIGSAGTAPFAANTANSSAVITRTGAAANKHNRGSLHIPYANKDTSAANGLISAGQLTSMNNLAPFLFNASALATLGDIQPILIHGTSKLNAIPLVSAVAQETMRTMRRRTVGVGK